MGATDAAEMLEAAKAECARLERIIADAIDIATDSTYVHPEDRLSRMVSVLERAEGESGGTPPTPGSLMDLRSYDGSHVRAEPDRQASIAALALTLSRVFESRRKEIGCAG